MMPRFIHLLLLVFFFLTFSACNTKEQPTQEDPFPKEGSQLSTAEAQEMTFHWEMPQGKRAAVKNQVFRLYRLASAEKGRRQSTYRFSLVREQAAAKDNSVSLGKESRKVLSEEQTYVWDVVGQNEDGERIVVKERSYFAIGQPVPGTVLDLFSSGCKTCSYEPDDCQDLICTIQTPCPDQNTHIATLTNFDLTGNDGFRLSSDSVDEQEGEDSPCIRSVDNVVYFSGDFNVNVPFDKIDDVAPTTVEALLFKGQSLVPEESISRKEFTLNNGDPASGLLLNKSDYLKYCEDQDSLAYRAEVNLEVKFSVEGDPAEETYTLVFYLPEGQAHTHGPSAVEGETQDQNRIRQPAITHEHQSTIANFLDCPGEDEKTTLEYYTCRDGKTLEHVSQHIVVIELPVCD